MGFKAPITHPPLGTFFASTVPACAHASGDACCTGNFCRITAKDSVAPIEMRDESHASTFQPSRLMPPTDPNDVSILGFGGPFPRVAVGFPSGIPQVLGIKVGCKTEDWIHKCQQYFESTRRTPLPHHLQQTPLDTSTLLANGLIWDRGGQLLHKLHSMI